MKNIIIDMMKFSVFIMYGRNGGNCGVFCIVLFFCPIKLKREKREAGEEIIVCCC